MKKAILFLFFILLFMQPETALAKTLPQSRGTSSGKAVAAKPADNTVAVSARLRRDKHALTISFGNLQAATNITYTLMYNTQGRQEGAGGSVRENERNSASRELLFGTCSKNVCTYHSGITNMKLEVTGQLKSGKTFTKRFKIKV